MDQFFTVIGGEANVEFSYENFSFVTLHLPGFLILQLLKLATPNQIESEADRLPENRLKRDFYIGLPF
jgi:hypothetical protein